MTRRLLLLLLTSFVAGLAFASGAVAGDNEIRLGIKGYDPVAYFTMGRPVQGKPEFRHDLDDVRYHFASAKHLAIFSKDPDHYAPRFQGLCAMGLGAKGYMVEANPQNWVIHEGRLYVTQASYGPAAFRKDPKRWAASAEQNLLALKGSPIGAGLSWW